MIGILIVTHGNFGQAILKSTELIVGPIPQVDVLAIDNTQTMEEIVEQLEKYVDRLDQGKGVLILTDMFGGTPTTLSLSLLGKQKKVEVITGLNLPMLIKTATADRTRELAEIAKEVKQAGIQSIKVAGEILEKKLDVGTHR